MNYIESLQDAVQKAHGCEAKHVESVPVKEVFRGQTIWDGTVEVFSLTGHPKATRCYAWGYHTDDKSGELCIVTALELPPVESAVTAVRAAIAGKAQK